MTLKPLTELGPSNPIYPFMLLSQYRILVCQKCQYACLAREVTTHLAKKHPGIDLWTRHRLVESIEVLPDVLRTRAELPQLQYPLPTNEPIPCLAPPKLDVLKCRHCGFNIRQVQAMQEHCTKLHEWVNPRSKGRPPIGHQAAELLPWIEGVACQRFFPFREGSKWFEVNIQTKIKADRSKAKTSAKKSQGTPNVLTSEASTRLQQVIDREARYREALSQPRTTINDTGTDTFAATSLWLDRTQWPSIYRGSRRDILRALIRLPNRHSLHADYTLGQGNSEGAPNLVSPREDEQKISCIVRALDSVIDRCEDTVRGTSHNILCWLLSSRLQSRRELAFNLVAETSSVVRYRRTQKQFLAFILRIYRMPDDSRQGMTNVKIKPEIATQLDRIWEHNIWNHLDVSKGTWPVMKKRGSLLVGIHSGPMEGQSTDAHPNTRACQGSDGKEGAEDAETDDENVEAWELEDEDDEDDESDYDDSGYCTDIDRSTVGTHQDLFSGVSGDSATSACDQFLEPLFQLYIDSSVFHNGRKLGDSNVSTKSEPSIWF
ncbi:hypothetical protein FOMG_18930 [Fusarium oxysporum f. sp. melonis 26406]|uniref:C2H2-type domain-containing protein n=1 Tax=Fusarium oxysporum f. sp. melonis 26406 TaxID=1089452 RepID=W9Z7U5_FUSOX|nr:hypothetical protein FOMG_18930 [Fusarium oxysporum f. sp. melonis 26406]